MILKAQIFKLNRDTEDQFESEFYINITRPDSAARLNKCMRWAAANGRSVTVFAKEDE